MKYNNVKKKAYAQTVTAKVTEILVSKPQNKFRALQNPVFFSCDSLLFLPLY